MTNHNGFLPTFQKFRYDCHRHQKHPYQLKHNPRPLALSDAITKALEYLLWYVPNINSYQSPKNTLIQEPLYDHFTFTLITEALHLNAQDYIVLDYIDDDIVDYYMDGICPHCQKLILTTADGETKTSALVRHMRNAIAHGYFTIVKERIIAFDIKHFPKQNDSYGASAIIQIDPLHLANALKLLEEEMTHEKIASIAFKRCGYTIVDNDYTNPALPYDFLIEKEGRQYATEIKKIDITGIAEEQDLDTILAHFPKNVTETKVLLMDSAVLDPRAKATLRKNKIFLLDRDNLKSLMSGDDVLKRIEREMR